MVYKATPGNQRSGYAPVDCEVSLEQEIKNLLKHHRVNYDEACDSFDEPDFCIHSEQRGDFHLDAKEKIQEIRLANWPETGVPQEHLFILDDLAARKMLKYSPHTGLVVRDNLRRLYFFFDVVNLFLMPRVRVDRRIGEDVFKGKWLVDLRNGVQCASLLEVFEQIAHYYDSQDDIFKGILACYGSYVGEEIGKGGIPRTSGHWIKDRQATR
jgi:hypothetical protein